MQPRALSRMKREKIMVVGANGALGRSLLNELGPEVAIAATRTATSPVSGYEHAPLTDEGAPPAEALRRCRALINAAGKITGDKDDLEAANVHLPLRLARAAAAAGVSKMVQVSSFSVAGAAEKIDDATPERPISAYGRSKAMADDAIAALATHDFAVESLRLPFMFSSTKPGLLTPLLSFRDRVGWLPGRGDRPLQRSMFTYKCAAHALTACAGDMRSGKAYAADPVVFEYALLKQLMAEEGEHVKILGIPGPLAASINLLVPTVGRRLFRSSVLSPASNRAAFAESSLEKELRSLIISRYRR